MKISNNALTFLLAQYRAIFKQAYLKGLAPAVLLTTALAAGAAQAFVNDSQLDVDDFANGVIIPATPTITQDSTLNLKDLEASQLNSGWTYTAAKTIDGADVTINGYEGRYIGVSGDSNVTIQNGGTLSFLNDRNCNSMLYGGGSSGNSGTLTVTGAGSQLTAQSTMIEFKEVKIKSGAEVTIGGMFDADSEELKSDAQTNQVGQWVHYANVYANQNNGSGGEATLDNATLNLNDESIFGADSKVTIKDESVVNFNGEWRALSDTTGYATAFLRANSGSEAAVTISGTKSDDATKAPVVNVAAGKHGAIFAPKINLTNAQVNIGSGSTLTFDGDWSGSSSADKKKATNEGNHSSTTLSLKDVTFDNQGTAIIGNATSGGKATFEGEVKLQGKVNNFAQVTVSGSQGNDAHLIVSEEQILKPAGKGEGWFAGKSGSIILSGSSFDNAVLELVGTNNDGLDLNQDIKLTSGDSVSLGQIGVSGSGTLKGEHFVLSKKLALGSNKLALDADVLELKSTSNATDTLSGFGVEQLTAHDNIVLEASGDSFTIDKDVILSRDNTGEGTIEGDNLIIGKDGSSGALTIKGGHYQTDGQTLTLKSGSLVVEAQKGEPRHDGLNPDGSYDDTYYANGVEAVLTLTGGSLVFDQSNGNTAELKITGNKGAKALVDLRNTKITWGSGSITISGDTARDEKEEMSSDAGEGQLYLTGSQFRNFIDSGKTKLTLKSDGVLALDSSVSGEIDVSTFVVDSSNPDGGKVNFSGGGTLFTEGDITIVANKSDDVLAFGPGNIDAHNITLNNKGIATNDKGDITKDVFTVSGGTLELDTSLKSSNSLIKFTNSGKYAGRLLLDTDNNDASAVVDANLRFEGGAGKDTYSLEVEQGHWTFTEGKDLYLSSGANFKVGDMDIERLDYEAAATLSLDNLNVTGNSSNLVALGSSFTVNTMQAGANTEFDVYGQFTINGRDNIASSGEITEVQNAAKTAGINLKGAAIHLNSGKLIFGDTAARALVQFDTTAAEGQQVTVSDAIKADYSFSGTSELRLDFTMAEGEQTLSGVNGGKALTAQQAKELKEKLTGSALSQSEGSYINVGDLALGMDYDKESMTAQWDKIKDFVQIESDVTNNEYKQLLVQNVDQDLAGQFGAIETTSGQQTASVTGNLGLHKAYGEGSEKFFASTVQNGQRVAAGLKIAADSSVALHGAGTIGTLTGDASSTLTFNAGEDGVGVAGTTIVKPTSSGKAIDGIGSMVVNNNVVVEGSAEVGAVTVNHSLSAENLTVGTKDGATSTVLGNLEVAETLTVKDSTLQLANGTVNTSSLVLNGATLMVGWDAQDQDLPNSTIDESASYTGALYAKTVDLSNGGIVVDPDLKQSTAIVGLKQFKDGDRAQSFNLGETGGNLFVGQNSAIGAGFDSMEDLAAFIAPQQVNGALSGQYKAILAVDGLMTVSDGTGLTMTAKSSQGFADYIKSGSSWSLSEHGTIANAVYFGAESALKLRAEAVAATATTGAAPASRAASPAVIKLDTADGQLIADGGEVLISGDLRANENISYQLFTDADGKVDVVDLNGDKVAEGKGIKVTTANGLLFGRIDNTNGGTVSLQVDEANAGKALHAASAPVVETLLTYVRGYHIIKDEDGNEVQDPLYNGYVDDGSGNPVKNKEYSNYFLADSIDSNGAAAEAAARLSVYGGAPQAALSAGKSSTDAIAQRFGIGAQSNLTLSGNSQGATLWLAPVYKSVDSDGFEAQGVDYGVDVDLYGVALGADYTLSNGITFGAMFNVGAGDIDGEGAAAQVSNDFDYYGFGMYAGYSVGQFSVIGDLSYTVADNEIEANTEIDKIGAQMDSSNLSLGVTGKYELSFNGFAITPHAGLRFSSIDLDDYTIDGEDTVASVDSDQLNIFALPVGLTVAKEFKGENWTVAPSFDLTLTSQFGDDELDGDVAWAGVSNLSTHTTTEVIDNFTYGATLRVEAKSVGGIALGLSVGYTGSSNTDEFGVNANARFSF